MSEFKDYHDNNLHSNPKPEPDDRPINETVNHTGTQTNNFTDDREDDNISRTQPTYHRQEQEAYRHDNKAHGVEHDYVPVQSRQQTYQSHCFKETVKNDRKTRKPYVFRKVVAFLLIAVLCGGAFQVGSVFTKPIVEKYLGSDTNDKSNDSNFSFEDDTNLTRTTTDANGDNNLQELDSRLTDTSKNYYVSPVIEIAENVRPSIVTIITTVSSRDWFNNQFDQPGAAGSGIIFKETDEDILIVTNFHVIDNAKKVDISFNESESVSASLVGYEPDYDLAVLSVAKKDMKKDILDNIRIATLGDSSKLKVGELAVAIGNPLGKGDTVTVGYISALNRSLGSVDKNVQYIQTDAAINPGNSGGALVNSKSEVIGINSIKLASTEVEGMGFAIPITEAKDVIEDIMNQVKRPVLGISGININESMAEAYNIPIGVLVKQVEPNSGADKGGIQPEDIIFEFNGVTIFNFDELSAELEKYEVGDTVSVKVNRKQGNKFVQIPLKVKLSDRRSITLQP
ncbi:trypsin-like peptidase domain-containing protein [Vallitalea pronyensis]|uniref:Trypsin-like peptidase domain-containing protein n=1 Tax=Vallitalea pronyensis TaxID=1348613 RepID=A0A8J8MNY4_9FIRM|nr:trypsin-like peptidase domain-containing protein [Vallitalea pronyensis]QUI25427.1 trypsin-like peptidase domain-containing protein [Vallitalea pronyensis]